MSTEHRARILGRKHATLNAEPFTPDDQGRAALAAALGMAGRTDRSWRWLGAYREAWDRAANHPELVTAQERAAWSRWITEGTS